MNDSNTYKELMSGLDDVEEYLNTHNYPPVWDETLKAWINRPPHPGPGKGAKE